MIFGVNELVTDLLKPSNGLSISAANPNTGGVYKAFETSRPPAGEALIPEVKLHTEMDPIRG
jgi:hypothetical protein